MPSNGGFRITRLFPDRINEQLVEPMTNLGKGIGRRAQRLVPKDTWALHDSIEAKTEVQGDRIVTTVSAGGGDVGYAMFVEQGTSRMAAQPYLRPALLQSRAGDFGVVTELARHGRVPSRRGAR